MFVMFRKTLDEGTTSGPSETKYYSRGDRACTMCTSTCGRYQVLYYYSQLRGTNKKWLGRGYLGKPEGLDDLTNAPNFRVLGQDITRSSAMSFRAGKFNYTYESQADDLERAMTSEKALDLFVEGPLGQAPGRFQCVTRGNTTGTPSIVTGGC